MVLMFNMEAPAPTVAGYEHIYALLSLRGYATMRAIERSQT
jgi:hypothetical protein